MPLAVPFRGVVIGGSLGGAQALAALLAGLPAGFPVPLIVVLHRAKSSDDTLIEPLAAASPLPLEEAQDKGPLLPGRVYVAPPDYHLYIESDHLALSLEPPVNSARPSVDVLFESAADAWGRQAIAVLLTGASADGAQGLARVKQRGGLVLVQDPDSAASRVMPEAGLAATLVDAVATPGQLASLLVQRCAARGS